MKNYKAMTKEELSTEFADIKIELRNLVVAEVMGYGDPIKNSKQRAICDKNFDTVFELIRKHYN
tara:strand:+ start:45 stop:236 length:192 start_codon:yes stop_codon:yes gene_type:complete